MKTHLLQFLVCIFFMLGCTRDISVQVPGPVVQKGQVGGKVSFPAGSSVDTTGLKVFSAVAAATPGNSVYSVDTAGKTSTTLAMNAAGKVLLMGYNYPGQTNADLSVESTALALLMNTLTIQSLTTEGKIDAVEKIKAAPSYQSLVE